MAENIIIHFRAADRKSVAVLASRLASPVGQETDTWRYPNETAYTLTIYPYDDLLDEYEPDSINQLKKLLNGLPTTSLAIVMRRSSGNRGVADAAAVATHIVSVLDGVVDDTCGEMWTVEEINSGVMKSEGAFLDCYRTRVAAP